MEKKIRVGISGAGGIAQGTHIPNFQKVPGVEVAAIWDPNVSKADSVAKQFGISKTFAEYRKMLLQKDIDVIIVCSPTHFHKEQAVAALLSGKDVFCEKPVSMSSAETMEVLKTVSQTGRKFMVGFPQRFSPASVFLKKLISGGEFGQIYYARTNSLRRRGIPGLRGWFTTKEFSGGGCLIDMGVHVLDRAHWLMGAPRPVSVTGVTFQKFKETAVDGGWPPAWSRHPGDKYDGVFDVEDLAAAFIRFNNGAALALEASWSGNSETGADFNLFGEKAGAREDVSGLTIFGEKAGVLTDMVAALPPADMYEAEIKDFISCVREDRAPITTPDQILAVSRIVEGVYKSAATGKEVIF